MKVAVIYDWIDSWGGAERLLLTLHEMFPDAHWFTSYVDRKAAWSKALNLQPSFMQRLTPLIKNNRVFSTPFYPFAFESLNFNQFDLVISVSSSFAKSVITRPETKHICYVLTPTRFLWGDDSNMYITPLFQKLLKPYLSYLKQWDRTIAQRPDICIAPSKAVQERVQRYYKRESEVVYPPFDIDSWQKLKHNVDEFQKNKFYLVVSRLEPYKKIELVIRAFNALKETLIVVGTGSEESKLTSLASSNIRFEKNVSEKALAQLYANAQALIMPQEEDFGYTAVEAQFFGCPVIAYGKGGALETVIPNQTGLFFLEQSSKALVATLEKFETVSYTLQRSVQKIDQSFFEKFSKQNFISQFKKYL